MARSSFGSTSNDWLLKPYTLGNSTLLALRDGSTVLTFYSAKTGGTPYADLLDENGTAATSITVTGYQVPRFQGPDGIVGMWADKGDGSPREFMEAQDLAGAAAAVVDAEAARDAALAATTTKVDKANMAVNVKDYGATGNGSTDDRAAIQLALDAAGTGGSVYFPPGTYRLATATLSSDRILKAYPGQTLYGSGRFASVLKVGNSFGNYKTVIGLATDGTACGRWSMTSMGIDQNSTNSNALDIANMTTYPRCAVRLGSYTAGSAIAVTSCAFSNGDNVWVVYAFADTIEVTNNHFLDIGGPVGTGFHDHSGLYTVSTLANSTQVISGNTFRGVLGSGGATTAIETHGGIQTITNNTVSSYFRGMIPTGLSSTAYPTDGITITGNVMNKVCVGVHIWSNYTATLTSGTNMRNVTVSGNTITIDRDAWNSISGLAAFAYGVLLDQNNNAPIDGLTISDNQITYLPISGTPPTTDRRSSGISIDIGSNLTDANAAEIRNFRIAGNKIVNPLSSGMTLFASMKRGLIEGNTVVDPAQSTEASVVTNYRSGIIFGRGAFEEVGFERNILVDTRGTHYSEYNITSLSTLSSATNCWARNNTTRYADAVGPKVAFYPGANLAGTAFFLEEVNNNGALPAFETKVGSKVTRSATGVVYTQTTAAYGTTWVPDSGTGTPESVVTAPIGSVFRRTNGGAATTLYVKESGASSNTGWIAK